MTINSILIVDDSEADQYLCSHIIKSFNDNIEILQAYDGKEALQTFSEQETKPDLIFLDLNMPIMDGFEFLNVFEGQAEDTQTRIFILSSSSHKLDKERIETFSFVSGHLLKPLTVEQLKDLPSI